MTDIDRQVLRDFMATEVMGWIKPKPLPEGKYVLNKYLFDDDFPEDGWVHVETRTFYTYKEFEKYEYWTTADGEPAKAPWGGLVTKGAYKEYWHPDLDSSQLDLLVDKMVEEGWSYTITQYAKESAAGDKIEVIFLKPGRRGLGNWIEEKDRRLAVLLAIKAAKEGQ